MILSNKELELKQKLEYYYRNFNKTNISTDPIEFPHRFKEKQDIEISAFISSLFAFGNIKQIMNVLNKIHQIIGQSPYYFVKEFDSSKKYFDKIQHRFYTSNDINFLFSTLKIIYSKVDSLEYYFMKEDLIKNKIIFLSNEMIKYYNKNYDFSLGIKFMFPNPQKNSACKRMNLFFRWMVRKDNLDFGLWKSISPKDLIIPVDVHIARISKKLNLTTKKNISWSMAEEITNNLKKFDENDPVKYDFALCHIGINKLKL